jgi:hypothetical protein
MSRERGLPDPYIYLSPAEQARLVPVTALWAALRLSRGNMPRQIEWLQKHRIPIAATEHVGRGPVAAGRRHWKVEQDFTAVSRKTGEVVPRRERSEGARPGIKAYVDRAILRAMFENGHLNHLLKRRRVDPKTVLPRLAALLRPPAAAKPVDLSVY